MTELADILRMRFKAREDASTAVRFSNLGRPDRQVWYDAHPDGSDIPMIPKTFLKFLYGDILEQLVLFLAREAGHTVESTQAEVEVDGIKGHIDAIIDGVVVDIKSASSFGFQKFERGEVPSDDPFGYTAQLSGYANVLTPGQDAAWVAIEKVSGDICVSVLPQTIIKHYLPEERISEIRQVIDMESPPERCYDDIPDGKSGNYKLAVGCSYCKHRNRCWDNLRVFYYSTGPRYLTRVERVPDVPEGVV